MLQYLQSVYPPRVVQAAARACDSGLSERPWAHQRARRAQVGGSTLCIVLLRYAAAHGLHMACPDMPHLTGAQGRHADMVS